MSDPAALLGLLADEDRLKVVAALALGADDVRAATGLEARAYGRALARLTDGGLVVADGETLRLDLGPLRDAVRTAPPPVATTGDPETDKVLRAFLRDGRLTRIPAARGKRRVLLEHVVQVFEPGRRYAERDVDATLRAFHDDYAALRRYLVDEDLMDRAGGTYWRIGGAVDV